MSRFHFQTSPSLVSGAAISTAVGGGVFAWKGSSSVRTAEPGRKMRVTELVVVPSALLIGMVEKESVTSCDSKLPDFGGIKLRMVQLLRCSMLSNQPAPTRNTHFSCGR